MGSIFGSAAAEEPPPAEVHDDKHKKHADDPPASDDHDEKHKKNADDPPASDDHDKHKKHADDPPASDDHDDKHKKNADDPLASDDHDHKHKKHADDPPASDDHDDKHRKHGGKNDDNEDDKKDTKHSEDTKHDDDKPPCSGGGVKDDSEDEVVGDGPYKNDDTVDSKFFGIWDRSNAFTNEEKPFVKGWGGQIKWKDLEAKKGEYDWKPLEVALIKAGESGKGFYGMVHVGPDSPAWLFEEGVPRVETEDKKAGKHEGFAYPYYLNDTYKKEFFRMIEQFAKFLRFHKYAENVGFVQVNIGCTGDAVLYKGIVKDQKYAISDEEQLKFTYEAWLKYADAMQKGEGRVIPLLVNLPGDIGGPDEKFALENIHPVGFKGSALCRGHHLGGERSWIKNYRKYMINPRKNSARPFIFTRTEMDQSWRNPIYQINLKLAFYWGVLNGLNQCLAVHDVSKEALKVCEEENFLEELLFFNKYAPQIWPSKATNAFIALHEGFNMSDEVKFPIKDYGKSKDERLKSITKEYEAFGAAVDDHEAGVKGQVYQRESQVGYNDVGDDIWPTNYSRHITQIDENETSVGLFRIGGKITKHSSKYSRFARGFKHKNNKNGMYFKMAKGFFDEKPVGTLSFRIVWYDSESGSWQFEYVDKKGQVQVGLDQHMEGDKEWKEVTFDIKDAAMNRTGERGSDFYIKSKSSTDAVFHMIEITRH